MAMRFVAPGGSFHFNKENIRACNEITGYSDRTFRSHFKWLFTHNWVGYNPKTKCVFIRSTKKVCTGNGIALGLSLHIKPEEIKDLKVASYTSFIENKKRNFAFYKKKENPELISISFPSAPKVRHTEIDGDMFMRAINKCFTPDSEPIARARSIRESKVWIVNDSSEYAGVANSLGAKAFNRTKSTASLWKHKANAKGFLVMDKVLRPDTAIEKGMSRNTFFQQKQETACRYVVARIEGQNWYCEQLEDLIATSVVLVRKRRW